MVRAIPGIPLLFFFLLTASAARAQGSWERAAIPTTRNLQSVCFADSLHGWVAGDSGTILHTTDGGASWVMQVTQTSNEIPYVFFLNRNLGWAVAINYTTTPYGTILLTTTDGGATWHSRPYPVPELFMTCILFTDSLHGWMGGRPNVIVRTSDGGVTWTPAIIDTSTLAFFPVLDIRFYNKKYGYACGGILDVAGVIWRTTNGGENWHAIDPAYAPADEVHKLHIFDSLHVMGAGGDPDFGYGVGMIRTSDGGLSWAYHELPVQGNAYDVDFRNDTEVWAPLGAKRKLIWSLDGGFTWTPVMTPDSTSIYDMTFPDTRHGFAVGRNGAFISYRPPAVPGVADIHRNRTRYSLSQNRPNPCLSTTAIIFEVPPGEGWHGTAGSNPAPGRILISDIMGNEVMTVALFDLSEGSHEVAPDVSDLADGLYFYCLQAGIKGHYLTLAGPKRLIIHKGR